VSKINKSTKDVRQEIQFILINEWDPIGVGAIPEAHDEYDGYISKIHSILISSKSSDDVFDYLIWVEGELMGLTPNQNHTQIIAQKLIKLNT
jgi:hypothetical protein